MPKFLDQTEKTITVKPIQHGQNAYWGIEEGVGSYMSSV